MKKELTRRHTVIVNMPCLLLETLIKYKCLGNFVDNYLSQSKDNNSDIATYLYCNDTITILVRSFIWASTPEGHDFWWNIYRSLLHPNKNVKYYY